MIHLLWPSWGIVITQCKWTARRIKCWMSFFLLPWRSRDHRGCFLKRNATERNQNMLYNHIFKKKTVDLFMSPCFWQNRNCWRNNKKKMITLLKIAATYSNLDSCISSYIFNIYNFFKQRFHFSNSFNTFEMKHLRYQQSQDLQL